MLPRSSGRRTDLSSERLVRLGTKKLSNPQRQIIVSGSGGISLDRKRSNLLRKAPHAGVGMREKSTLSPEERVLRRLAGAGAPLSPMRAGLGGRELYVTPGARAGVPVSLVGNERETVRLEAILATLTRRGAAPLRQYIKHGAVYRVNCH